MKGILSRQKQAEARNAAFQALTPEQRLAKLDDRLGVGVGAKRQRAILAKLMAEDKTKKAEQAIEDAKKAEKVAAKKEQRDNQKAKRRARQQKKGA